MKDVWLCLDDFQARLEQCSRTLKHALDMLQGLRHAKVHVQEV